MDENNKALNTSEENTQDTSPLPQQTTGEVEDANLTGDAGATETEEDSHKGFSSRVRELNQRAKQAEEKAQSLEQKLAELTGSVDSTPGYAPQRYNQTQYNPQEPIVSDGEELSVADLNRRIAERDQRLIQQIDARSELRARQAEAITRINNEASAVIQEYPELNPDSENFNKDLSDSITEATEAYVRANPYSASVNKFVAKLMKPYKGAVETEVGKASEQIAKQVSQSALRPTSVSKQEKTAADMSPAELERKLGVVYS